MKENRKQLKIKRLFSDTIAFTISSFASKILVFLLMPLYTAVLSTEEYGIADLLTNTINVLYPILTLSIMESTLRFAFDKEVNKDEVLTNSLFFILLSQIILLIVTPFVGEFSVIMKKYWGWFFVMFFCFNLQQVMSQYIKGIGKTKIFAISGVLHTLVIIISNIVGLIIIKAGINAYFFSIIAGYCITTLFLLLAGKVRIRKIKVNFHLLKEMLKFSVPMVPSIVAWWVSTSADKYIIISYLGVAVSGVYSIAYKIPSILTLFTNIFNSAWTISAIEGQDDNDNAEFQTMVYKGFNAFNVCAASILILGSQVLGKILFSKEFYTAWHCVPMLLVAYVFSGLAGFMASSFRAVKYTKGLLSSTSIGAMTNIILNFLFIKRFGIMGAAFTTMIGFAVTFYIRTQTIKKVINIRIDLAKDSVVYLILITQAFIIGHEMVYSYIIGVILFVLIIIAYRKIYINILKKGLSFITTKACR